MTRKLIALWAVLLIAISGCGGGGGSLFSPVTSALHVFATDDLNTNYDHVWVTIDKVVLDSASGPVTVFDQTASGGTQVDLRTLHDSSGARFKLLGGASVAAGTYTGVEVTLANSATIVATGQTTGTSATFGGADATFTMTLQFATAVSVSSSASPDLDIDFDLAHWTLNAGVITADTGSFLKQGETSTPNFLNPARHEKDDFGGHITALSGTAPTQTFTVVDGERTVSVTTSAATTIYNNDGSASPALADGQPVHITGVFDPTTKTLNASAIEIIVVPNQTKIAEAKGLVTAFDATAGTLTVMVHEAEGFLPSDTTITIQTDANTLYFAASGLKQSTASDFFGLITANTTQVEVQGSFASGVLSAAHLRIEEGRDASGNTGGNQGGDGNPGSGGDHPGDQHHLIHIVGKVSAIQSTTNSFTLSVNEWEGANLSSGSALTVTVADNTLFGGSFSAATSAATFIGALSSGSTVVVEGTLDTTANTLTAKFVGSSH